MNGKPRTAKMPNPSIAIAVGSYAGSMNMGIPFALSGTRSPRCASQTHEIQRPKMCERFGSAARLKADSHPIGGRDSVVTTGDEAFEMCLGTRDKRSPLWV
jgi:hypothetical protein